MEATLEKVGGRRMVSIPDEFLYGMQMADNDAVDISMEGGSIVIRKKGGDRPKSIDERCKKFLGVSLDEFLKTPERFSIETEVVDWGVPVGSEAW